jgi:hypothetical protein
MIWSVYAIAIVEAAVQEVVVDENQVVRGETLVLSSKQRLTCVARLHALSLFLPLTRRFREAFLARHQRPEALSSICL